MSVVIILITASLSVALGFLGAFIWSVKTGQYEDDYTPSVRMLFEDGKPTVTSSDAAAAGGERIVSRSDRQDASSRYVPPGVGTTRTDNKLNINK